MTEIIRTQFCCTGGVPWVDWIVAGEMYVKRSMENDPFVKEIVLPNCLLVGPAHMVVEMNQGRFSVCDGYPYEDRDITDEEYALAATSKRLRLYSEELKRKQRK